MSKRKRKSRARGELEKFKEELQTELAVQGREATFQMNEGEKMSEVLEDFVEPYLEHADTLDAYRKLIGIAVIAWNAALLQGAEREKVLEDAYRRLIPAADKQARADFQSIVEEMILRKERYFADNRRGILNYRVTEMPTGDFFLSVASLIR
jgi:hypothetical protein